MSCRTCIDFVFETGCFFKDSSKVYQNKKPCLEINRQGFM